MHFSRHWEPTAAPDELAAVEKLTGLGVSAGIVEGIVRMIRTPDEADLDPGEVLVATVTDVGYMPLVAVAAAVVTDVGWNDVACLNRGARVRYSLRRTHAKCYNPTPRWPTHPCRWNRRNRRSTYGLGPGQSEVLRGG